MKNLETEYGKFYYKNYDIGNENAPTIIFLTSLGPNISYYDYYEIFDEFKSKKKYNLIALDLLGRGYSSESKNEVRNLENISKELLEFIEKIKYTNLIFCCHSFSALYILNIIESEKYVTSKIKAFIGIDPSTAEIMQAYKSELYSLIEEVENAQKNNDLPLNLDDQDINPCLNTFEKKKLQKEYPRLIGSISLLSEMKNSITTINEMNSITLKQIPSLSILSSLNYADYKKYSNIYFNSNVNSVECTLNSHHYIHWVQPQYVCDLISIFLDKMEYN